MNHNEMVELDINNEVFDVEVDYLINPANEVEDAIDITNIFYDDSYGNTINIYPFVMLFDNLREQLLEKLAEKHIAVLQNEPGRDLAEGNVSVFNPKH